MSNEVFPVLPGLKWGIKRYPEFKTTVHQALSGREYRLAQRSYPKWHWELSYEFLRAGAEAELQTLVGMFLRHRGAFDSFRFLDLDDNSVTDQLISSGAFTAGTTYQMVRTYGGFTEPITDVVNPGALKVGGNVHTSYTISAVGILTSTGTPAGSPSGVTWTGQYYWRVRFKDDETEFEQFLEDLWSARTIHLVSAT